MSEKERERNMNAVTNSWSLVHRFNTVNKSVRQFAELYRNLYLGFLRVSVQNLLLSARSLWHP